MWGRIPSTSPPLVTTSWLTTYFPVDGAVLVADANELPSLENFREPVGAVVTGPKKTSQTCT